MRKILVILGLSCATLSATAQEIHDANHNLVGFMNKDGSLVDQNKNPIFTFSQDGTIRDAKSKIAGFIVREYELQDKSHKLVAYITREGNIENPEHKRIGHINSSGRGPVTGANNEAIGYINKVEPMWAASYFFLLNH
jgi:hypothetical protein